MRARKLAVFMSGLGFSLFYGNGIAPPASSAPGPPLPGPLQPIVLQPSAVVPAQGAAFPPRSTVRHPSLHPHWHAPIPPAELQHLRMPPVRPGPFSFGNENVQPPRRPATQVAPPSLQVVPPQLPMMYYQQPSMELGNLLFQPLRCGLRCGLSRIRTSTGEETEKGWWEEERDRERGTPVLDQITHPRFDQGPCLARPHHFSQR